MLVVDLFPSKICNYPMKKYVFIKKVRTILWRYLEKRKPNQKIIPQTDQKFQRNEIKRLNALNNVTMFSIKTRNGKAFAAKQKIRDQARSGKRLKPNELIEKGNK